MPRGIEPGRPPVWTGQRDGTWARGIRQLQARADGKGLITGDVSVDSTVCRAHQHAAGAGGNRPAALPSGRPTTGSDASEAG
ncbi:hypothetical protein ACF09H_38125 [Streptomyces sp. NPDC014983]|uniref:hypothetical protein n=1 Tax=Streptomyces sp. NPDC014983 TaxID=3364933 RepID=UPI0036FB9616